MTPMPRKRDSNAVANLSIFEHNLAVKNDLANNPESTLFRARVDAVHLEKARRVLSRLGMTPGDAVNVFFCAGGPAKRSSVCGDGQPAALTVGPRTAKGMGRRTW